MRVLIASVILVVSSIAAADEVAPQPAATVTPPARDADNASLRREVITDLKDYKQTLNERLEINKQMMERSEKHFEYMLIGMTVFLALSAGMSVVSWFRVEGREKRGFDLGVEREAILRQREEKIFSMTLDREQTESQRGSAIFEQSQRTLTLVNETLTLAVDASRRASQSLHKRLAQRRNDLELRARDLIQNSGAETNYKVLVENSPWRTDMLELAQDIHALETTLLVMEDELELNPYSNFVRGMHSHLQQIFKPAFDYWKAASGSKDVSPKLRVLALYWTGYECNNLGRFQDAIRNFDEAAASATGAPRYELERIALESKFFDRQNYSAESVLPSLADLLERSRKEVSSNEFHAVQSRIAGTYGNVLLQMSRESRGVGDTLREREALDKAEEIFLSSPLKDKWIYFGLAEAVFRLGRIEDSAAMLRKHVYDSAVQEANVRPEPRTKVQGLTTVTICSMRMPELNVQFPVNLTSTKHQLSAVADNVTVYSVVQKRNVSKMDFQKDLLTLEEEFAATKG